MVEVTEKKLVEEVMVKIKEEMVKEVMMATWDKTDLVEKKSCISESLLAFYQFCDEQSDPQSDPQSENEDSFDTDTHLTGGNLIYPILPYENTHRRRKLFSPRHFAENNDCDVQTKNQNTSVKKTKSLKICKNNKTNKAKIQKSKIETSSICVSSTTINNDTMPVLSTSILSSISRPKMSFYKNTMPDNEYDVLYDHNSDLYIPFQPVLNVDLLLKK